MNERSKSDLLFEEDEEFIDASEAFTYEDTSNILKILTGAVINLLPKGSENE